MKFLRNLIKGRLYRRWVKRDQYPAYQTIYQSIVDNDSCTHTATVLDGQRNEFTGLILGYSDEYLFLRHSDYSVSYYNRYDVLSVDDLFNTEWEKADYAAVGTEAKVRLNKSRDFVVRYPGRSDEVSIECLTVECLKVINSMNWGSAKSVELRLVSHVLDTSHHRFRAYLPMEINIISSSIRSAEVV